MVCARSSPRAPARFWPVCRMPTGKAAAGMAKTADSANGGATENSCQPEAIRQYAEKPWRAYSINRSIFHEINRLRPIIQNTHTDRHLLPLQPAKKPLARYAMISAEGEGERL